MSQWRQNLSKLHQQSIAPLREGAGKTLLEMLADERIVIEHHKGVQCYSTQEILVRSSFGYISIAGEELKLCCMSRYQLCVMGTVHKIELIGGRMNGSLE